jgi:CRISPR-associated protein (TIGR03984 family)
MTTLIGGTCEARTDDQCRELLGWVLGTGPAPLAELGATWLLAHCDGGVVWGHRRTDDGSWALSGASFPELSPAIDPTALQELRLFGPDAEELLWAGGGTFTGRRLSDSSDPAEPAWAAPFREERVLIGDRLHPDHPASVAGFTPVMARGGSRQVLPVECQDPTIWRLILCHYLERLPNGAVRVAATRLVELKEVG